MYSVGSGIHGKVVALHVCVANNFKDFLSVIKSIIASMSSCSLQ